LNGGLLAKLSYIQRQRLRYGGRPLRQTMPITASHTACRDPHSSS